MSHIRKLQNITRFGRLVEEIWEVYVNKALESTNVLWQCVESMIPRLEIGRSKSYEGGIIKYI